MTKVDLIGKKIIDIFVWIKTEPYGLDNAEVYIKLENESIIELPYEFSELISEIKETELNSKAKSIFENLSDIPTYHVNKNKKTIEEITSKNKSVWNKIKSLLFFDFLVSPKYTPYKITYTENQAKHLKNKKIVDILYFEDDDVEKIFLELENGYIITETAVSPNGTGSAGINIFKNFIEFQNRKGEDAFRLSEKIKK